MFQNFILEVGTLKKIGIKGDVLRSGKKWEKFIKKQIVKYTGIIHWKL